MLPDDILEEIAALADTDVRTVRRYFAGLPIRPSSRRRIARAFARWDAANNASAKRGAA